MEELWMEYLHGGEGEVRTLGVLVVHLPEDGGWQSRAHAAYLSI